MQEILLLFVVCWSLSVVCRSFERIGNACLYVCFFVFFLVPSPGSCRKLSWWRMSTGSDDKRNNYNDTSALVLNYHVLPTRESMHGIHDVCDDHWERLLRVCVSLSFSLLLSSWSCFLNTAKETVVCLHRLLLSSSMMHHAG
jgi:hypothetical protein